MKQIIWENPNKMHMDSGFKLFDKQTNLISTGNVFATTQRSVFIAPWREKARNGKEFNMGELTKADLKFGGFNDLLLPPSIRKIIFNPNRTENVILYAFRVFQNGMEDIFGYVITDSNYNHMEHCVVRKPHTNLIKRVAALSEAMKYICKEESIC